MAKTNTKSKPTKLSDLQIAMIGPAAKREDRCVERTNAPKGAAQGKAASKHLDAGIVREIRAKPGMLIWRRDEKTGLDYSLKLTAGGVRAALGEEVDVQRQEHRVGATVAIKAASTSAEEGNGSVGAARKQSRSKTASALHSKPSDGGSKPSGGGSASGAPSQPAAAIEGRAKERKSRLFLREHPDLSH